MLAPCFTFFFSTVVRDGEGIGGAFRDLWHYAGATYLHFDLGIVSVNGGQYPMRQVVTSGIPVDLGLVVFGLLFGVTLGVTAALLCGPREHPWIDRFLGLGSAVALAAPAYLLAYVALFFFAHTSGDHPLFFVPEQGDYEQPWNDLPGYLRAILVPAFIIGLPLAAACFRMARLSLRDVAGSRHLQTARANGLSEWRVQRRHAFPSAAPPVIALVGVNLSALVFNAVLVEVPFNMPGAFRLANLGHYVGDNGHLPNNAALQGIVLEAAVIIAVALLLCDVLGAWLDPKLRRASG